MISPQRLQLIPSFPSLISFVYVQVRQYDKAKKDLEKAISLDPEGRTGHDARKELGRIKGKQGQ